ncbi:hypothetical protein PSAC2689_210029 [Paraburkholderia sacchari]
MPGGAQFDGYASGVNVSMQGENVASLRVALRDDPNRYESCQRDASERAAAFTAFRAAILCNGALPL